MAQPRFELGSNAPVTPATGLVMNEASSRSSSPSKFRPLAIALPTNARASSKDTATGAARAVVVRAEVVAGARTTRDLRPAKSGNTAGEQIVDERAPLRSDRSDAQPFYQCHAQLGGLDTRCTATRNSCFDDSPRFMLNTVNTLGAAERFAGAEAHGDIVLPLLELHDFNFTSLVEAV